LQRVRKPKRSHRTHYLCSFFVIPILHQTMSAPHPLERAVHFVSFVHDASRSLATGKMTTGDLMRATVLKPRNFPSFLVFTMASSGLLGYMSMDYVLKRQAETERLMLQNYHRVHQPQDGEISEKMAMVTAMIQNAKTSSFQENLDNAFDAQDRFMLGSQGQEEPAFMKRIRKRSEKLRQGRESTRPYLGE